MRLKPEQLQNNLERNGLAPVYTISGEEPLQMIECADQVRDFARHDGFEERVVLEVTKDFNWQSLTDELANMSLFSSKKLIELRMGKPGREGGAVLVDYANNRPADTVLIITCDRLDKQAQRSKWYSALDKIGICLPIWPVNISELPDWIRNRMRQKGKSITADAAKLIAERVEGNLLAAKQEIDNLCLLAEYAEVSTEDVMRCVSDSSRFDVFEMVVASMTGDAKRALHMLDGLRSEGLDPAGIYGALMWEFRRLCDIAWFVEKGEPVDKLLSSVRIWDNARKFAIKAAIRRHHSRGLQRLLREAVRIDQKIKSSERSQAWGMFESFFMALAGKPLHLSPSFKMELT